MQARMKNPALMIPDLMQPLMALGAAAKNGAVPAATLELLHLRVSQINGCGFCVDMHAKSLSKGGETSERLFAVAAWRESPYFSAAERAALALAEASTRLSDRPDPVPDSIWNEAAEHYDEAGLASLILNIGLINFWNRMNVPTRQIAGTPIG